MYLISISKRGNNPYYALWSQDMSLWSEWDKDIHNLINTTLRPTPGNDIKTLEQYKQTWISHDCIIRYVMPIDSQADLPTTHPELFI